MAKLLRRIFITESSEQVTQTSTRNGLGISVCNHPLREDTRRSVGQTLSWCELLSQRLTHSSVEVLTQHFFLLPYLPFPKMQLLNINMKNKYLAD